MTCYMVYIRNCWFILQFFVALCSGDFFEKKLLDHVLSNYSLFERPVEDHRLPVVVQVKFALQQLVDVDEKNQIITTSAWLDLKWNNYLWKWNPEDYGFLNKTRIPYNKIWTPDILLYNSAEDKFDATTHTSVVVDHHGNCLHMPPGIFRSTCKIDVSNFPFDEQKCTLKFGVWSYHQEQVDLHLQPGGGTDATEYTESGEWKLVDVTARRNSHKYRCCPERFVDVTITVTLRRRTMFYVFNLILPCILNSILTLLTFFLPAEAAEKITLAITVLLAQIVFMLLIIETMPPTSDAIPIISKYFACSLVTVCASVGGTVLVLSFYYTSPEIDGKLPPSLKKFFLITAPKWLHMNPYCPTAHKEANATYVNNKQRTLNENHQTRQHQKNPASKASFASRTKYVEVHLDACASTDSPRLPSKKTIQCLTKITNSLIAPQLPNETTTNSSGRSGPSGKRENLHKCSRCLEANEAFSNKKMCNGKSQGTDECTCQATNDQTVTEDQQFLLQDFMETLKRVNRKLKEEKIHNEILREWQFASRVLDKMLLWFFSLFVFAATLATLFAVPNIVEAFRM